MLLTVVLDMWERNPEFLTGSCLVYGGGRGGWEEDEGGLTWLLGGWGYIERGNCRINVALHRQQTTRYICRSILTP